MEPLSATTRISLTPLEVEALAALETRSGVALGDQCSQCYAISAPEKIIDPEV